MRIFSFTRGNAGHSAPIAAAALFCSISFSLLAAPSAEAHWRSEVRREFTRLEAAVDRIQNDEMGGIRGSVAVSIAGLFRSLHFRNWSFTSDEHFEADGKPLSMAVSRTGRKVSPLVVFFPGVFGDSRSGGALMVGRQARRAKNHVLILPNPWGSDFQDAHPRFMPGDFQREAKVMVDMVAEGIRRIGPERISEIHFVGESYGGFLAPATAVYAHDAGRFSIESVLSISVPFHIGNAIGSLDGMADAHQRAYFEGGCGSFMQGFVRTIGFVFEIFSKPRARELYSKNRTECSKAVFAYLGFQQPLFQLGQKIQSRLPSQEWESRPLDHWRKNLRFRDFGRIFYGQDVEKIVSQDSATLHHWVARLRANGVKTLGLIARNDPLNPPPGIGSKKVIDAYPPEDVLVLERGGHLGFRGEKAYRQLLRAQLKNPTASFAQSEGEPEEADFDEDLDNDVASADDGLDDEA